jgi:hypothetical protein
MRGKAKVEGVQRGRRRIFERRKRILKDEGGSWRENLSYFLEIIFYLGDYGLENLKNDCRELLVHYEFQLDHKQTIHKNFNIIL